MSTSTPPTHPSRSSGAAPANPARASSSQGGWLGAEPNALSADQVEVTRADGTVVTVRPYTLDLRYDVPGRPGTLGTAIAVFDADRTGSYLVGTETKVADTSARIAVGDDLAPATVRAVMLPGLAALLSVIAAIALAARTRSGRERRNQP